MKVSVVIPCYNSERYISQTIDSVVSQTISPLEVILVDDQSQDGTLDLLRRKEKQYKGLVKITELQKNQGASYARNYGAKQALGDYILFMDADDLAEPKLIEKYCSRLEEINTEEKGQYKLCYSAYIQIDENDCVISEISRGIQFEPGETLGYEFVRNYILSTSGVLVKKDVFTTLEGFNENIRYSEDWDLWLRLAGITDFAYVDEPLIKLRRHGNNLSSKVAKMLQGERDVLRQYGLEYIRKAIYRRKLSIEHNTIDYVSILFRLDHWNEGSLELKKLIDHGYDFYNLYFYLGLYYLKNREIEKALDYFLKTINLNKDHSAALNNAGALLLVQGNRQAAREYFSSALRYFPNYLDAGYNFELLAREFITIEDLKFTWRELRKVLLIYSK